MKFAPVCVKYEFCTHKNHQTHTHIHTHNIYASFVSIYRVLLSQYIRFFGLNVWGFSVKIHSALSKEDSNSGRIDEEKKWR